MKTVLTKKQTRTFRADYTDESGPVTLIATVRYDDECGNDHNSFAITGELYERHQQRGEPSLLWNDKGPRLWLNSCGRIHDDIAAHIPELAPLIKWHLTSSDEPMHYIANTMYHAREHGPTHAWVYFSGQPTQIDPLGIGGVSSGKSHLGYLKAEIAKKAEGVAGYRIEWDEKTVKKANLDAARSCAVWPDATLEQLRDKKALEARLPALMMEFRAAVESLGFTY